MNAGKTAAALHAEGLACWRAGDLDRALEAIGRAVDLAPETASIRTSFGLVLAALGLGEAARAAWRGALALQPAAPEPQVNLANAALAARPPDQDGARRLYRRALAADPAHAAALGNLGLLAERAGEPASTLRLYARALALSPDHARLWANLGSARHWRAHLAEAGRAFDRALGIEPSLPGARFDRAINRLIQGDWRGLADYEARLERPGAVPPGLALPFWQGEDPKTRHILLFAEQGHGDALQFLRFVPRLRALGARVSLLASPRLVPLLREMPGLDGVHEFAAPPPADLLAPLMSLPWLLGLGAETAKAVPPYLAAIPSNALAADGRKLVGLLWAGNPANETDARRSLSLDRLRPLLARERLRFVSLQFGPHAGDVAEHGLETRIERPRLGDFKETAALVASLDLVVTVDTAMAHLAGSLGKETWVLLSHVPDWRWGIEGERTSWYPSLRLFRQKRPGDWESAIAALVAALDRRFP